jgi:hypothetical protein
MLSRMEGFSLRYGLMLGALVAAVIAGNMAMAIASAVGSYWAGTAALGTSAVLLAGGAKRLRGIPSYEYAILIAGSLLAVLIAGMSYAAIVNYPLA